MKPEHTLASLIGKTISFSADASPSNRAVSIYGEAIHFSPEMHDTDAGLMLQDGEFITSIALTPAAMNDGVIRIHEGGDDAGVEINVTALDVGKPAFSAGTAHVEMNFQVDDRDEVQDSFDAAPEALTGHAMADVLFMPFMDGEIGVSARKVRVLPGKKKVQVLISAEITDPCRFNALISEAGRQAGRDDDWSPSCAGEAIFEAFLGANDAAAILDYGLELMDETYPEEPSQEWANAQ